MSDTRPTHFRTARRATGGLLLLLAGVVSGHRAGAQTTVPATGPATRFAPLNADGLRMAATPEGRQFLTYLASCALSKDAGATAVIDGQRYDFPGAMGLAPTWLERPLTPVEQRWVSAGILARLNAFGRHVEISMRHTGAAFPSLDADDAERAAYSIPEGDFFGNLFVDPPIACVAVAARTPAEAADPVLHVRVGTEVDPARPPIDGLPVSRCGLVIVGPTADGPYTFRGERYAETIRVYLAPGSAR